MSQFDFEIQGDFQPAARGPEPGSRDAWWFVFAGNRMLAEKRDDGLLPPFLRHPEALGFEPRRVRYMGTLDGEHCYAAEVEEGAPPPEGYSLRGLLGLHAGMPQDLYLLGGRAVQIIDWDRKHQFCGACGTPLEDRDSDERAKQCPSCALVHFPRLAPAVMALVQRDERLLLARSPHFPESFYSVLAGFADPGETLEACVRREVREEVGLAVDNIRYFGSQPWPFPHSLMIAFVCDHAGGEIQVDGEEIIAADWFHPDDLPQVPGEVSIAGKLIEDFVRNHRRGV